MYETKFENEHELANDQRELSSRSVTNPRFLSFCTVTILTEIIKMNDLTTRSVLFTVSLFSSYTFFLWRIDLKINEDTMYCEKTMKPVSRIERAVKSFIFYYGAR